jgi:hypothetical protein
VEKNKGRIGKEGAEGGGVEGEGEREMGKKEAE